MGKVEPANVHPGEDEFGEFLARAEDGTDKTIDVLRAWLGLQSMSNKHWWSNALVAAWAARC